MVLLLDLAERVSTAPRAKLAGSTDEMDRPVLDLTWDYPVKGELDDPDADAGNGQFRVEDYRKPEYQVRVSPAKGRLLQGETMQVMIDARYFFGEPVSNARVKYRVYHSPHYWWDEDGSGDEGPGMGADAGGDDASLGYDAAQQSEQTGTLDANGKPVANSNDLRMSISMMAPDSDVRLRVLRSGSERNFTVKLGELPTTEASIEHEGKGSSSALSGVSVEDLSAQTAKELGLPANAQGVVVTNVGSSSPAAEAGLRRGDVIQEVNRKPVKNTSDFERAVAGSKEDTLLLVNRHGSTLFLAV